MMEARVRVGVASISQEGTSRPAWTRLLEFSLNIWDSHLLLPLFQNRESD